MVAAGEACERRDQPVDPADAGRRRAEAEGVELEWAEADAENLPFEDAAFDALTFTYLLRYVDDPAATVRELVRVVKPGGVVTMLEFHIPRNPVARASWEGYVRIGLPLVGRAVSPGWAEVGRFLGPSIRRLRREIPPHCCPGLKDWLLQHAPGVTARQIRLALGRMDGQ